MKTKFIIPTWEAVQNFAYQLWLERGKVHGYHEIDWLMAKRKLELELNYENVFQNKLVASKRTRFGDRKKRKCRYCDGTAPDKTFSTTAHAVSEMIGNKAMFADDECDTCNATTNKLEDHLANLVELTLRLTNVVGKGGKKTFETRKQQSRIANNRGVLAIHESPDDPLTHFGPHGMTHQAETKPFVPIAVFKCLTKFAMAVLPDDELTYFTETRKWVMNPDHEFKPHGFSQFVAVRHFLPGNFPIGSGFVSLFRRRKSIVGLPYMIFLVAFTNLAFQITLPFCTQDSHLLGQEIPNPILPYGWDFKPSVGPPTLQLMPLGSSSKTTCRVEVINDVSLQTEDQHSEWEAMRSHFNPTESSEIDSL